MTHAFTMLGIDPGLDGGLVFLDPKTRDVVPYRMPTVKLHLKNGKVRRRVDARRCAEIIRMHNPAHATIEEVHAIGGGSKLTADGQKLRRDGVVGAFSFGTSYGLILGVLGACGIDPDFYPPQEWKNDMRVTSDKATSIRMAQRLFPRQADLLTRDGEAEAALIALYGYLRQGRT